MNLLQFQNASANEQMKQAWQYTINRLIIGHQSRALSAKLAKQLRNRKNLQTYIREGIKELYKSTSVKQFSSFLYLLGGYHEELRKGLISIMDSDKELSFLTDTVRNVLSVRSQIKLRSSMNMYKLFECKEND